MADNQYQYYSNVSEEGRLDQKPSKAFQRDLLALKGSRVHWVLKKYRKQRSGQQNRYYWGVVVRTLIDCAQDTWGEAIGNEEAHEILKVNCNYKELINKDTGEILKAPCSTADLTTVEFMEYQDRCIKFIFNWFNAVVPLPNEQGEIDFD